MTRFDIDGMTLVSLVCGKCGVRHAIPAVIYDTALEEGGFWTCPNGHSRGFHQGRRQKEAVVRERDRLKQENARLAEEAAAAERSRQRAAADLRRHKKRAAAGTCPCCSRTFANMARHLKTQHPEFVREQGARVVPLSIVK